MNLGFSQGLFRQSYSIKSPVPYFFISLFISVNYVSHISNYLGLVFSLFEISINRVKTQITNLTKHSLILAGSTIACFISNKKAPFFLIKRILIHIFLDLSIPNVGDCCILADSYS